MTYRSWPRTSLFLAALALSAGGCATSSSGTAQASAPSAELGPPTGELQLNGSNARSVSFNATSVFNPQGAQVLREDGTWGGRFGDVTVTADRLVGSNLKITRERTADGTELILGEAYGKSVRYERKPDVFNTRGPNGSMSLVKQSDSVYGTTTVLTLKGDAALENPPWPQYVFALLAIL